MSRAESSWQLRQLPFMTNMLIGLTVFFLAATVYQLFALQRQVTDAPRVSDADQVTIREALTSSGTPQVGALIFTLSRLESNLVERRYHITGVMLMARLWARYLGFVTGMILALVGATFILGKLQEASSTVNLDALVKATVVSTSPGLVLAVLGTTLMLATILTNPEVKLDDSAVYLKDPQLSSSVAPGGGARKAAGSSADETGAAILDDIRKDSPR